MARGRPAVVSAIVGIPFVVFGLYVYFAETDVPPEVGIPFYLFGTFVILIGLYIHFVAAPDPPKLAEDEEQIAIRHPTQRVAFVKMLISVPLLFATVYILFFTIIPYVYPTVTFLLGLYFLSSGLQTYWTNSLTTYYVTTRRVISYYRLLSLTRREIRIDKVRGVDERRTAIESIVGLGDVRIASGSGGGTLEITMRNIKRSTEFADEIRSRL
jgi:uncharacterized membrane protein YdbT with pleckstrin-like domain